MLLEFTRHGEHPVALNPLDIVAVEPFYNSAVGRVDGCRISVRGVDDYKVKDNYEAVLKRVNDASTIH